MALNVVPNAAQSLDDTRDPIRNNFIYIDRGFSEDHVPYQAPDEGKHAKVTLPDQTVDPTGGFEATETGFFNFLNPSSGRNETYVVASRIAPDPTNKAYPMTAWGSDAGLQNWWTYTPSGFLIKWGRIAVPGGSASVMQTFEGPAYSHLFSATANCLNNPAPGTNFYFAQVINSGANSITVRGVEVTANMHISTQALTIAYVAIGY